MITNKVPSARFEMSTQQPDHHNSNLRVSIVSTLITAFIVLTIFSYSITGHDGTVDIEYLGTLFSCVTRYYCHSLIKYLVKLGGSYQVLMTQVVPMALEDKLVLVI